MAPFLMRHKKSRRVGWATLFLKSPRGLISSIHGLAPSGFALKRKVQFCYPAKLSNPSGVRTNGANEIRKGAFSPFSNFIGVPTGIRTPVAAVKGRCPWPLDDGDVKSFYVNW